MLKWVFGADTSPFRRSLNEMRSDVKQFSASAKSQLAGLFGAGAITAWVSATLDAAGRIDDLSKRLDMSAESFQRLSYASKLSGGDMEVVGKALTILTKNLAEAKKGGDGFADAAATLNVNLAELAGMSPEGQMIELARGYQASADKGAALSAIMKLLGKSGAEIIPMLAGGPEELTAMLDEATVASNEQIETMAKIGDAYAATGRTREQAQRDVKALLDAERQGPEAVQAWIDSLNRVIDEADRATEASTRAAEEAQREIDEVSAARMSAAEAELTTLLDSRKELAAGLAKEADEETKGVIQLQQEAELASLDAQIAQKADAYAQLAQETGQAMADAIVEAISQIQLPPLTVPLNYAGGPSPLPNPYPMAAGGFGTVTKPTLFLAGEAGPEQVAFSGANRAFASGGMDLSTLTAEVAGLRREMGQQVGMAVVHALAKYGVA